MLAISDIAIAGIIELEVSSPAFYARTLQYPTRPGGASGVTIGVGYDLGYCTRAQFLAEWGPLLRSDDVRRLAAVVGLKFEAAAAALHAVADVMVPFDAALKVFHEIDIPRTILECDAALPNCDAITPDCLGALVSLVFNRGDDFSSQTDRRREMVAIKADMATGNFADIPAQIRSMKRLWEDAYGRPIPGVAGLVDRRDWEADLFAKGLADMAASPARPVPSVPSSDLPGGAPPAGGQNPGVA